MSGSPFVPRSRLDIARDEAVMIVVGVMAFMAFLFVLTWKVSEAVPAINRHFRKMSRADKWDWCSRVPSVVHSQVVLVILFWQLPTRNWSDLFQTEDDLTWLQRNLCISMGYFFYDLCVILISRLSLWWLYVFHHVAALWPLTMTVFTGCEHYTFFAAAFFGVELTILPLQITHWYETLKIDDSPILRGGYHATFWLWLPARLYWPVYIFTNCAFKVVPIADVTSCNIPVLQGGFNIMLFCWLVFFAAILPAYWKRIRGTKPARRPPPVKAVSGEKLSPVTSPTFKNAA